MPLYEYECDCGRKGEYLLRLGDPEPACDCGGKMKRLVSQFGGTAVYTDIGAENANDRQKAYLRSDKWYAERKKIDAKGGDVRFGSDVSD